MTIGNATLYHGDALTVLRTLPAESVQMCVTSPQYFGLRDYGHPGQIGLEASPAEFVAVLVAVFEEVRRVLRSDGTLWLNIGDSYAGSRRGGNVGGTSTLEGSQSSQEASSAVRPMCDSRRRDDAEIPRSDLALPGFKPKDLMGMPWRVALALQAAGWYLRRDIIWHKPNPMPESARDRPTTAHEYLFLLAKSPSYFYDAAAIAEPVSGGAHARRAVVPDGWNTGPGSHSAVDFSRRERAPGVTPKSAAAGSGIKANESFHAATVDLVTERNKRSVWTIPSHPFPEAHFATFPPKLVEPCILAGSPEGGVVLDPFNGAGTTGVVCANHGRHYIGIEINGSYLHDIAVPRITDAQRQGRMFA